MRLILCAATLALVASAAVAQEATPVCTNAGNVYQIGEQACIPGCHGAQRFARCDLVGTATTWTTLSDACPSASIGGSTWRLALATGPTAVMTPIPQQMLAMLGRPLPRDQGS